MPDLPPIDIQPAHWEIVQDILHRHAPGYEVWAFGSRARGQAKRYSDLDLAVVGAEPLPLSVRTALNEAFSESDLPWRVDVVDWTTTSPSFQAIIARDRVLLQSAGGDEFTMPQAGKHD